MGHSPDTAEVGSNLDNAKGWRELHVCLRRDRNDPLAYNALARRIHPTAQRDLWPYGWHVIEDAVADTCTEVILSLERARGAETFAGFVYGHYLNVRRRIIRDVRQHPVPMHEEIERILASSEPDGDPTPDQVVALRSGLAQLPSRERRAVELRYLEKASSAQIAAELAVTEGNARRIVFSGLARLRKGLLGVPSLPGKKLR
jgi:RNA polymerase sigma factor (sigma-70 family)